MNKHLILAALVIAALGLSGTAKAAALELFWNSGSGAWSESKWSLDEATYTSAWIDDGLYGPTFEGTGGTVIVDGTYHIGEPGIGFDTDGYILDGGTLIRTFPLVNPCGNAAYTSTISSVLDGTVGLTIGQQSSRTGTVILTGSNIYTGDTTLTVGTLRAAQGTGLPSTSYLKLNGGVYETSGTFTRVNSTTVAGTNFQWSATTGGGFSAYGGKLTITIGNDANTEQVMGTVVGNNAIRGTLKFGSTKANAETEFQNNIDLGNGTRTINVAAGAGGDFATISGVIRNSTGTGSLTKTGGGRLVLSNTNTYAGATTISGGTLSVGADGNLGDGSGTNSLVFNGGTLQVTGTALTTFGTHTPTFTAAKTVGLDIADAGNTFTVSQVMNQAAGGLTKRGAGTLVLTADNTYTGLTTVSAGKLVVNNGNGTGAGAVSVAGNATLALGDDVTTISTGPLTMQADSIYEWRFATGGADEIDITGNLTLTDDWTLKLIDAGGTRKAGEKYDLFTYTGTCSLGTGIIDSTGVTWDVSEASIGDDPDTKTVYITGIGSSVVPGDTNGDFVVDAVDYIAIKTNFGLSGTGITRLQGDLIDNDIVDWADLQELMDQFGTRSVGGAPPAPEPATLGLLAIGAAALLRRRQGYGGQVRRRRARA